MRSLIAASWLSRAVAVAVELGIPDLLAVGLRTAEPWPPRSARTSARWLGCHTELLAGAGLRVERVVPTESEMSVIEAARVGDAG